MQVTQLEKPSRNRTCKNCHQKEWIQKKVDLELKWVQIHPKEEHGRACQLPICASLGICNNTLCKYILLFITYLISVHPYEAKQKAEQKQEKRKQRDLLNQEKQGRKKQKEGQKLSNNHFTEFIKAKNESG